MSRDQKPGRFKLVGGSTPNYGRRSGDKSEPPVPAAPVTVAHATPSRFWRLLLPLLFLAGCASGGAIAVFFGFAGIAAQ